MMRAYKYRIYPTPEQANAINQTIGVCRLVYNLALEVKIRAYQEFGVRVSAYEIKRELKYLRKEYSWIEEVSCQAVGKSILNVDDTFKKFFSGRGFPKYKKKRNGGSFRCQYLKAVNWDRSLLSIPKIYNIPIVLSRRFEGHIKAITISRTATNKYFASILVEDFKTLPTPALSSSAVGVDLGITHFATLSTGEKIDNPKHLQTELKRLKSLQRRVSRKKKGSQNRRKAVLKLARLHERIANQRKDFLHKVSSKLIGDNQTDTICLETLSVKNMVKNHSVAQVINDVGWSEFVRFLEYKGKWYGKNVIKINRFYASSKTYSNCGHVKDEMNLSERTWDCSSCGANHDRDINAAINIKNSGMGSPGVPVELPIVFGAVKQESIPTSASSSLTLKN